MVLRNSFGNMPWCEISKEFIVNPNLKLVSATGDIYRNVLVYYVFPHSWLLQQDNNFYQDRASPHVVTTSTTTWKLSVQEVE